MWICYALQIHVSKHYITETCQIDLSFIKILEPITIHFIYTLRSAMYRRNVMKLSKLPAKQMEETISLADKNHPDKISCKGR